MKIWLFIPCYHCQNQVARVFKSLEESSALNFIDKIVFLDNQSTDNTVETIINLIQNSENKKKYSIFKNLHNYGLGGTHKVAINMAFENKVDWMGIMHGDDQANVDDLSLFIKNIDKQKTALLGSRFSFGSKRIGYQRIRVFGNLVLNFIYTLFTFKLIFDLGSGLNFFNVKDLKKLSYLSFSDSFDFNAELLLRLHRGYFKTLFIPIEWKETDQVSNARNFQVAWKMLKTLCFHVFHLRKKVLIGLDYVSEEVIL